MDRFALLSLRGLKAINPLGPANANKANVGLIPNRYRIGAVVGVPVIAPCAEHVIVVRDGGVIIANMAGVDAQKMGTFNAIVA